MSEKSGENGGEVAVVVSRDRSGKQPPALRRQSKKWAAIGADTANRVWEQIRAGKSIPKAAEALGIHYNTAYLAYQRKVAALLEAAPPEGEAREAIRLELDEHLREVLETSKARLSDPRHGAIALKTLEQLAKLHGADKPPEAEDADKMTADQVADRVRLLSPALQAQSERLQAILSKRETEA